MRRFDSDSLSRPVFVVFVLLAVGIAQTPTARAGGLYLEEFSTSAMGTAGAGSGAMASDAGTSLHNPAGMTRLEGHQIWGGFTPGVSDIKFNKTDSPVNVGGNGGNQGGFIPLLGAGYAHKLTDRVRLGFSVYSPAGATLNPSNDWAGRNQLTEISLVVFATNPGVAIELTDWLSVGGNAVIMHGNLDWKLIGPVTGGQVHIEDADDTNAGGMASVLLEPMEGLRFGIVYQSEVKLKLRGNLNVPVGEFGALGLDLDLPMPQTVSISTYWDATEKVALLFSAGWQDWSTADHVTLGINELGGQIPLGFQDTWRIGFGIHYQLVPDWKLTTGYAYDSSALRNKDRLAALPVDEQHRLAFGAMHQLSESTQLGLIFEWVHLGKGKIRQNNLRGSYGPNEIFFFGATINWMTPSWRETFGLAAR